MLGKTDLYEYLGLNRSSSLPSLQAKVGELYREVSLVNTKDAYITAKQALIGNCQAIFKDEENRKRYDKTLGLQRLSHLTKSRYAGVDGEITADEFEHLVVEGTKLGIAKEEIISRIKEICAKNKWSVQLPGKGSPMEQSITCGICGSLNKSGSKACGSCGFPVEVNCPKCAALQASSAKNCNKCGYSICDMPNALPYLREAKDAIADGDFSKAEKDLNKADAYWLNHPEILSAKQQIKTQSERSQSVLNKAQDFLSKGQCYPARQVIVEAKAILFSSAQLEGMEKSIAEKITLAERALARAKSAVSNTEREDAFFEALNISSDCQEAIVGLEKLPLEAPTGLNATLQEAAVLLNWRAVNSKAQITYRVLRKAGALPSHASDGEVLTDTSQLSFLDLTGQPGRPYHYAVFAQRGKMYSAKAAFSNSLTQTANVEHLSAVPSDGSVTLRWQAPPNAIRVEVYTKTGSLPKGQGDGTVLPTVRMDGATHGGLVNDSTQGYLVIAVFRDGFGKELPAKGVAIMAAATAPPKPVEYLIIQKRTT
ncbi:MAG: hypothetical protein IPN76_22000 [Saprospiraceae bacterium]|nr:hypothetical protein [Saprospiraceae bacterium]